MSRAALIAALLALLVSPVRAQDDTGQRVTFDSLGQACPALLDICSTPLPGPTETPAPAPSGVPTPTPHGTQTPRPGSPGAPTPTPTPHPAPSQICTSGFLNRKLTANSTDYGLASTDIPSGTTLTFCLPVQVPLIPDGAIPARITASWFGRDANCRLSATLYADADPSNPDRMRTSVAAAANGNLTLVNQPVLGAAPNTAPGVYILTLTGGSSSCDVYRVFWTWSG